MTYLTKLISPLGPLSLASDGESILGLWLEGQKYFASRLEAETAERPDLPVFAQAEAWLDAYFEKRDLPPLPPLSPRGSAFRQKVWDLLLEIPLGQTATYGTLAGYAGGVEKKRFLLELEGADLAGLYMPKRGTAL